MTIFKQMAAVTLASASLFAWAQAPQAAQGSQPAQAPRADHHLTQEQRQEMRTKCVADPSNCEAKRAEMKSKMKEHREEIRAKCEADPKACEAKRAEIRAKCEADPKACDARRKEMRERMQEHRKEMGGQPKAQGAGQPTTP